MDQYMRYAEVYDRIHPDIGDEKFYLKEAKKAKGKILEVACGTGRIYLKLLKDGIDAYGIDYSKRMLGVLNKKAEKLNLKPKVYQKDMRDFRLKEKFSLIIIPFRSFLHIEKTGDQIKTLKTIRKHLAPHGKLILNFFFPTPKTIANYGREKTRIVDTPEGRLRLIEKVRFADEPNQIIESKNRLIKNGKVIWQDKLTLTLLYKKEFELLLKAAGFRKWRVYGGFDYRPLTSSKQEMVWIITR